MKDKLKNLSDKQIALITVVTVPIVILILILSIALFTFEHVLIGVFIVGFGVVFIYLLYFLFMIAIKQREAKGIELQNKKFSNKKIAFALSITSTLLTGLIIIAVINLSSPSKTTKNSNVAATKPNFNFATADITQENVKKEILKVEYLNSSDIKSIDIDADNNIKIRLYEERGSEKELVQASAQYFTQISEKLFKNSNVNKVDFWVNTKMEDDKGNASKEPVINFIFTKDNVKDISWDNFNDLVNKDYHNLLKVVNSYYIAPSISNKLN